MHGAVGVTLVLLHLLQKIDVVLVRIHLHRRVAMGHIHVHHGQA